MSKNDEGYIKLNKEHGLNPTIPICFWCGEDQNEIVLLGAAYKGEAPMRMLIDYAPCDSCRKTMDKGIFVIEVSNISKNGMPPLKADDGRTYPTGRWWVIKRVKFKKMFNLDMTSDIIKSGKCLMTEYDTKTIGLRS